ncbi:MAG: hypothetical protein CMN76_20255 [Spirochaetaceae bacterium]|nr:hypothetical protein [Spirochaetaceae bacterium]|tara:strand:+ start:427 stop:1065 length:639 start_codon:yes stop_codon:yes gene_type:complete
MRFVLLAAFAVGLSCSSHEADNYARHTAIIDTLEELQKPEHGISGSSFYSSPRYTEIHRQNPTEISWFTTNWNWAKVDFSQFKGGVVEAIFLQSRAHETRLKELGFQYMAGDFYNQPYGNTIEEPVGWYRKTLTKYNKVEQTGLHQSPIDAAGAEIVFKRVYINQRTPGILFATYHYIAARQTLRIDFAYSAFPGQLSAFEAYHFEERLVTE